MKMTVGRFKGQRIDSLPSQYLAWLVTRDHIRFKHWHLVKEALCVLRSRDFDAILDELKVESLADHRPTAEQERQTRREERRARFMQQQAGHSQVLDAGAYVRRARVQALQTELASRQQQADPNDISDLI